MMEKKIIDLKVVDVTNAIAILFTLWLVLTSVSEWLFDYDIVNRPCEEQANRTVADLDVKCFEYYKIN